MKQSTSLDELFADGPSGAKQALEGFDKSSESSSKAYRNGFEAGRRAAMAEIVPQIEKISAHAVEACRLEDQQQQEALEAFRGQVTIHACGAELVRAKLSMQRGECWGCGGKPDPNSKYSRCRACDSKSPTNPA